ncbi:MAG: phosphatidylserine decarboxylase family protein [Cyclobacteriaceae bacterium]|nr:phosphatidylserine decarboxylase family protein [Cyclobacteriaceae bacterium]
MTIHREGFKTILVLSLVLAAVNYALHIWPVHHLVSQVVLIISLVLFVFILQFFRNPAIQVAKNPNHVLSPADGKVVVVEKTIEHEYLEDQRIQVSVFMSPINVHVNRNPVDGVVAFFKYHPGKFLPAFLPKSSIENERTTVVYAHSSGVKILIRQIAGTVARRIKWYIKEGDLTEQGKEFGFIKFGSRVDVFLPLDAEIKVQPGMKVKGGKTVLAELK